MLFTERSFSPEGAQENSLGWSRKAEPQVESQTRTSPEGAQENGQTRRFDERFLRPFRACSCLASTWGSALRLHPRLFSYAPFGG